MKKILLIISIISLVTGCTNNKKITINNIQTANYNNINLLEEDFNSIKDEINKLNFEQTKQNNENGNILNIISKEKIYNFKINKNNIYYEENNKYYISKNITKLNDILKDINTRYTDTSFFNINYQKCDLKDNHLFIKLDNTNNCLYINTTQSIFNLRINTLENINNNLNENNLIYQKDQIQNESIIIKTFILDKPKIKISFDTKYNYTISFIPILNQNQELEFDILQEQKNRH